MRVAEIWAEIDKWMEANAPAVADGLAPPATTDEIAMLEDSLDLSLPKEIEDSLRKHNGETEDEVWIFVDWSLLSTSNIAVLWKRELKKPKTSKGRSNDRRIKSNTWSKKWIPFAYDGSGGFLIVDMDPGDEGNAGQIIRTSHDDENSFVATSFGEFLERYKSALGSGAFEFDGDELDVTPGRVNWWID